MHVAISVREAQEPASRIVPFKIKCAKHSYGNESIHRLDYDEDVFACIQSFTFNESKY